MCFHSSYHSIMVYLYSFYTYSVSKYLVYFKYPIMFYCIITIISIDYMLKCNFITYMHCIKHAFFYTYDYCQNLLTLSNKLIFMDIILNLKNYLLFLWCLHSGGDFVCICLWYENISIFIFYLLLLNLKFYYFT